jgi:hypothetical protein
VKHHFIVIGLAGAGLPAPGFAQLSQPPVEFGLEYHAGAGCPGRADFETAVISRVPGARTVAFERAKVRLHIELSGSNQARPSSIAIQLADGTSMRRSLPDTPCADAAESMAVMAAMVLDGQRLPAANTTANRPETGGIPSARANAAERAAPVVPAAPPAAPVKPLPAVAPTTQVEPAAARRGTTATAPRDLAPSDTPTAAARVGAALAGAWESEVAPDAPLGVLAGVELRWELEGFWAPSLRLSFLYTGEASVPSEHGDAAFQLLGARLSACPLRFGSARSFGLFACADFDAGRLRGVGEGALNERTQDMAWLGAGPGLRGEYAIGRQLALEALAGARFLLNDDRFIFAPAAEIHDVARVSVGLGLGVAGRLP